MKYKLLILSIVLFFTSCNMWTDTETFGIITKIGDAHLQANTKKKYIVTIRPFSENSNTEMLTDTEYHIGDTIYLSTKH